MVVTKIRNEVETDALIVADTSEPRLIDALLSNGMNVNKTEKYAGSVVDGIKRMLDFTIVVTEESYNMKHELRNYIWNDKKSSTPMDADNHGIDATRYGSLRLMQGSDSLAHN
jgi:phage terminase large subunit